VGIGRPLRQAADPMLRPVMATGALGTAATETAETELAWRIEAMNRPLTARLRGAQVRWAGAATLALLAAAAFGLGGCGMRGPLEAPAAERTDTGNATPGTPGAPTPPRPSILDPILR
jgi:predicted small lipoprotein YifL